jgi:hypothetical protein
MPLEFQNLSMHSVGKPSAYKVRPIQVVVDTTGLQEVRRRAQNPRQTRDAVPVEFKSTRNLDDTGALILWVVSAVLNDERRHSLVAIRASVLVTTRGLRNLTMGGEGEAKLLRRYRWPG